MTSRSNDARPAIYPRVHALSEMSVIARVAPVGVEAHANAIDTDSMAVTTIANAIHTSAKAMVYTLACAATLANAIHTLTKVHSLANARVDNIAGAATFAKAINIIAKAINTIAWADAIADAIYGLATWQVSCAVDAIAIAMAKVCTIATRMHHIGSTMCHGVSKPDCYGKGHACLSTHG